MYNKTYTYAYISLTKFIDMGKEYLGEFEELVLTMVAMLGENAYGNTIVTEIKEQLGREVNLSAVHVTLYRLEDKGFLISEMRGATQNRGGRRKRYFSTTSMGIKQLQAMKDQRLSLWNLIPQLKFSTIK